MYSIKRRLAVLAASSALVLGFAAPVAATSVTSTVTEDNSISVTGDCSGVVVNNVEQDVEQDADNDADNTVGNINILPIASDNYVDNNQSNSQSSSQSSSVTFAPDCSVTNVTQAAQQVDAPEGGVKAGGGAFAAPLLGLSGSLGSLGYGVLRLRRRG